VVYRVVEPWRKVIGTTNSDPSKDKLEELPFGMGEDGEHVLESNTM
jgi:hypothetical protein